MRFATILYEGTPRLVAAADERSPRLIEGFSDMFALMDAPRATVEAAYAAGKPLPETGWRWLAPVPRPGKIIGIGLNYADHCRETGQQPPEKPLVFAKLNSSVIAHGDVIEWDPSITNSVDYEAELAVVIGKQARLVSEENALSYVFGYTVANDVTARDLQKNDGQWTRAKGMDTFCPLGPWLVSADEVPDPQSLSIRCMVDGELRQNSNTSQMLFKVKTLISYLSRTFTLYRGDVILTGTPAGVGSAMNPPRLLRDKATVTIEIEKLGRLENVCRELTFRVR
ncbi:MAG: fumarylacetoacetate hydrolase family protein [Anaerolineae bacterium]|nr:fumarylacetoacetate hydrolase family protein [Anaerolineae bacterium]